MILLAGCMTMDGFFNPEPVDAYVLDSAVVPAELIEQVSFSSGDFVLGGVWVRQAQGGPTYVYFHGNTGNIDHYWEQVGFLWGLGFEVFTFDYRGYGVSEGSSSWESLPEDGIAAVDFVSQATGLAPGELHYHGLSLGGSAALRTALQRPPATLVSEDTFASADDIIDDSSGLDLAGGWFVGEAWENVTAAAAQEVPYLVSHALDDTYIRSDAAFELFDAAPEPKRLFMPAGCDHAETYDCAPEDLGPLLWCWAAQDCAP